MTAKVILNPYSNHWNSLALWPETQAALKAAGVDFDAAVSERKGHVTELAEQAARDGFSPIIVSGGDGTIGDAVNGLALAAASAAAPLGPLGIMPTGSANDFVFNLGMSADLDEAARTIAAGKVRTVDLCKCNQRYFANNSACGLEPYITLKHEHIRWIKGIVGYLAAAVLGILDRPEWRVAVKWDGGEFNGPVSLVTVGNGRRTGGFFMTPHADPQDGKLTLAFGYRATRLGLLGALPRAFNEGEKSYVYMDGMRELHAAKISIHLDRPAPAHTDGELFSEWVQDLEYSIQPGRLKILAP